MPLYSTGTGTVWIDNQTIGTTCTDSFFLWNNTSVTPITGTYANYNVNVWNSWVGTSATTPISFNSEAGASWQPAIVDPRDALIAANRRRSASLRSKVKRRAADRVALELLMSLLTPEQRDEYERLLHFHVVGEDGTLYRIRRGWAGNIDVIRDGQPVEKWCVHPRHGVPVPDNLVAQKLMLESGRADELRQIANVTPIRRAVAA